MLSPLSGSTIPSRIFHRRRRRTGSAAGALDGGDPNGSWQLFIQDSLQEKFRRHQQWLDFGAHHGQSGRHGGSEILTMTASATNITVGNDVVYTIGVTNYGPSVSSNSIVSDTLPSGFTLVGTNSSAGSVSRNGSVVIWNVGTLANAGAQLVLTAQANVIGNNLSELRQRQCRILPTRIPTTMSPSPRSTLGRWRRSRPLSGGMFGANGAIPPFDWRLVCADHRPGFHQSGLGQLAEPLHQHAAVPIHQL